MNRTRKIRSFDKFSDELLRRQPEIVAIQANFANSLRFSNWFIESMTMDFPDVDYSLLYFVRASGDRTKHKERLFTASCRQESFADHVSRRDLNAARALLAGQIRVAQLSLMLADTQVYLASPGADLSPMPQEELDRLHEDAQARHITPPALIA